MVGSWEEEEGGKLGGLVWVLVMVGVVSVGFLFLSLVDNLELISWWGK